ncbi:hypothetical protein ZYGR_0P01540 [Zygosaccharomyces rouxii]|uniref:ZYRO0E03916p n=2 Tax=Zygosaccharomyces rouxii TaxID=4956 RepID=C5E491_ZYGRC|nr:uncharacterized protein ZYRO0E03916g [Zygosaccharomyces rouxii]GAV49510.1 hypothetical protein ZYGR_0P01540 [Zygosaccharomyces rouxii]CAQ43466.1 High-affinity glucose transporter HGT1 [Zygosaccharomyces rouxii]CAR30852.1 ZYRO0E03916p [Zygosaccharomyces rouxii]
MKIDKKQIGCALMGKRINYRVTIYDKFPKIYNIFVIGFTSCISGLMFGFDVSSMSSMIGTDGYKEYFGTPGPTEQGGITACMPAGSFVASLIAPYFSDNFGRRVSLHLCAIFWMIGAVLQCASQDLAMLCVGRVVSGLGIGFGSSVAPVYCSEIAPPKIRGAIGGLFQFSVTLGIMILFFIGYGAHFINGAGSFRLTWGIELVPGACLLIAVFFLPESPRWLALHDYWEEAEDIVIRVAAKGNRENEQVMIQLEEIREQVEIDKEAEAFQLKDLFRPKTRVKTMVGMMAQMWQQMCGMNVMMYYIVYIFTMAGFKGGAVLVSGSIQYVLNVVMTIPALFLMDKCGRRPVLLIGGLLMCAWLFAVGGLLATYSDPYPHGFEGDETVRIAIPQSNKPAANGVIACSYLFVCSYAPTWGVCIWIYCAEIFNNTERAKGSGLCTAVNWIFNFALALFVPSAFKNLTWKTYIMFGVFCVALTINTFLLFPETKGKTLEEIDQMWEAHIPAWKTHSWVPTIPSASKFDQEMHKTDLEHVEDTGDSDRISPKDDSEKGSVTGLEEVAKSNPNSTSLSE